jgi:hypothetical protein
VRMQSEWKDWKAVNCRGLLQLSVPMFSRQGWEPVLRSTLNSLTAWVNLLCFPAREEKKIQIIIHKQGSDIGLALASVCCFVNNNINKGVDNWNNEFQLRWQSFIFWSTVLWLKSNISSSAQIRSLSPATFCSILQKRFVWERELCCCQSSAKPSFLPK